MDEGILPILLENAITPSLSWSGLLTMRLWFKKQPTVSDNGRPTGYGSLVQ